MAYLRTYNTGTQFKDIELPFSVIINFEKVIDYWKKIANSEQVEAAANAQELLHRIAQKAPAILLPFNDLALITKHQEEIRALLAPLFPELATLVLIKK